MRLTAVAVIRSITSPHTSCVPIFSPEFYKSWINATGTKTGEGTSTVGITNTSSMVITPRVKVRVHRQTEIGPVPSDDVQTLPQKWSDFYESCAMCWNEWKLNFAIIIFWFIHDFVHNFQVFLINPKRSFWASQKMRNLLNRIFVNVSFFLCDS